MQRSLAGNGLSAQPQRRIAVRSARRLAVQPSAFFGRKSGSAVVDKVTTTSKKASVDLDKAAEYK